MPIRHSRCSYVISTRNIVPEDSEVPYSDKWKAQHWCTWVSLLQWSTVCSGLGLHLRVYFDLAYQLDIIKAITSLCFLDLSESAVVAQRRSIRRTVAHHERQASLALLQATCMQPV